MIIEKAAGAGVASRDQVEIIWDRHGDRLQWRMIVEVGMIYAMTDPDTARVRYVGYTTRTLVDRLKYHVWDSKRPGPHGKTRKARWIQSLTKLGKSPGIAVLQVTLGDWCNAEKFWIAAFENAGTELLNMTIGGKGVKRCAAK